MTVTAIVQNKTGDPVPGANVYQTPDEVVTRLVDLYPFAVSFAALPDDDRKNAALINATGRAEREVACFLTGSVRLITDPVIEQRLLFRRTGAYDHTGSPIDKWLDSWEDGIALLADEFAFAELNGEEIDEPSEDEGLVEVELDAKGAQYRERWATEGAMADFFQSRKKIRSFLAESFPNGGKS